MREFERWKKTGRNEVGMVRGSEKVRECRRGGRKDEKDECRWWKGGRVTSEEGDRKVARRVGGELRNERR